MEDTNALKRELDQRVSQLSGERLREVLDFVESLRHEPPSSPPSVEEKIEAFVDELPSEIWKELPADGAEEHDHYIYGTPKRNG